MRRTKLPEVCVRCKRLKVAELCKRFKGARHNHYYHVCLACLDKESEKPVRKTQRVESKAERVVRQALQQLHVKMEQEYELGPYLFDFAFPKLRLLLEVDSSWHSTWERKQKDRHKAKLAEDSSWNVVRVKAGRGAALMACRHVLQAKHDLGL